MSIVFDIVDASMRLNVLFPELSDWDRYTEVKKLLTPEQKERNALELEIIIPLTDQGVNPKEIRRIVDEEIAAMGLPPMKFDPVLRREDYE